MKSYRMINYMELSYIIVNKTVSDEMLCDFFQLSPYRFKSDVSVLIEMAPSFSIELIRREFSLSYEVIDKALFERKKKLCDFLFMRYFNTIPSDALIVDVSLGIEMLNVERYVTIDDLADASSYSRSSIRDRIRWVRSFLQGYGIETVNTPHHGIAVEGEEFSRRLCLIALDNQVPTDMIIGFDESAQIEPLPAQLETIIRQTILPFTKPYGMLCGITSQSMLFKYISVYLNRISLGHSIEAASFPQQAVIRQTQEWTLASRLIQSISRDIPQGEVDSLAAYLIIIRDFPASDTPLDKRGRDAIVEMLSEPINKLEKAIVELLNNLYAIELPKTGSERYFMRNSISKIVVRDHFSILPARSFITMGRRYASAKNPLIKKIRSDIQHQIEPIYGYRIPSSQLQELMMLLERTIQAYSIDHRKPVIAIDATMSPVDGPLLRSIITKRIPGAYYERIDAATEKQESEAGPDSHRLFPYISVSDRKERLEARDQALFFLEHHNNCVDGLTQFLRNRRDFCSPNLDDIIVSEVAADDMDEFLSHVQQVAETAIDESECTKHNRAIFGIKPTPNNTKATLFIVHNTTPFRMERTRCHYAVMVLFKPSRKLLPFVDLIMRCLLNEQQRLPELFRNPSPLTLNAYLADAYD